MRPFLSQSSGVRVSTCLPTYTVQICGEVLELLDKYLVPSATTTEASVFYLKMKADYHRYLAEFKNDDARKESAENTLSAYKAAQVRVRHGEESQ